MRISDWSSDVCSSDLAGKEGQQTPDRLIELAGRDKVVGIGGTGLDYYYEHSPRAAQQVSFRSHIAAARATGLPLIVHARDADDDTVAVLQENGSAPCRERVCQ